MDKRIKDLTGKQFGKLTVIKLGKSDRHGAHWHCQCDCGGTKELRGDYLRGGVAKNCGCLRGKRTRTATTAPTARKSQPIANTELLKEIERSKLSYCYFLEPEHAHYDARVHTVSDITADLLAQTGKSRPIIRLYTYDHIPLSDDLKRPRQRGKGFMKTNFPPFRHVMATMEDGSVALTEVGRSHWTGGLGNGFFSVDHGRTTDRLGRLWWDMTVRYSRRPNWNGYSYKDEMISAALLQLSTSGLEFDESKTDNPFAFYTTCIYYSFLKVLQTEQKGQDIRDQMLTDAGAKASAGWQDAEYLRRFEPVKLKRKAGRPPKARTGIVSPRTPS